LFYLLNELSRDLGPFAPLNSQSAAKCGTEHRFRCGTSVYRRASLRGIKENRVAAFDRLPVQPGLAPMEAKSVDALPDETGWRF